MDTGDVFSMSTIFTKLDNQQLQRLFLVSGLHNNILFENLNIIFLHSLNMNNDIPFDDKNNFDKMFNEIYNLFLNDDPPNIPYSFIDTLNILNIIIQINQKAYYLFMNLIFEASDETFKDHIFEYITNNNIPIEDQKAIVQKAILFSEEYPLIYKNARLLYFVNQTDEEQKEASIIETDYSKYKIDNLDEIKADYNDIFKQINNIRTINDPNNDFLDRHPYFFRINTPKWTTFVRRYYISQEMYDKDYRRINYFIRMIIDNINFIPICTKLLSETGADFCNLKYLDNYNVTPLMYACGYSIDNLDNYISANITDDDNNDDSGGTFTFINRTIEEIYPHLLKQIEPTTPEQVEAHTERIRPLRKLLEERGLTWDTWYNNPDLDMTHKDAMINLFYLINNLNNDFVDDNYDTLQIASNMMRYELLELIRYPNTNGDIDFKFHYTIDQETGIKIETIGITYIMNEEKTNARLDQLRITYKDQWTVYKCCLLLTRAKNLDDLYKLKFGMEDIFHYDNKKYKLICALYDPHDTTYDYNRIIQDVLQFYLDNIYSTHSITAKFFGQFAEVFSIYRKSGSSNFRQDYDEFFDIDEGDDEEEHENADEDGGLSVYNQTTNEMIPILLHQMDITTPADGEDHNNRIEPLKKLLRLRSVSWINWYTNPNIDMRYKDAMINLFYLIDNLNNNYDDYYYDTLEIASDMMRYELLELIKYPNTNSGIDFKFHYGIEPDSDDKINYIAITYIMNDDETDERLDQLHITNRDEWTVYKCCLLLRRAQNARDLNRLHLEISKILNNDDNNKYKLICTIYDPDRTSDDYDHFIEDILEFYHDDLVPTSYSPVSITANFAEELNEVFVIYKEVNNINYREDYDDFFNIDNDDEQSGGSEPQQPNQSNDDDDDILPPVQPQLIRSQAIIPQNPANVPLNGEDNNQPRQTAGATPEQLIQFQMLALKMLSFGADACNLTQQNNKGFRAYNYAVKHRLLDVVYQMDKLLYTNTNLYDTIKSINVPNTTIVNDYIYGDDININDIEQYFVENTDKVVFKYGNNYTIIHLDQIKPNIIDAKRYTCNETSNDTYRPPDKMIDRINPIFHTEKIGNIPINGGVLFKDIISIDTNMSRFYELEDTNNSYISFVSSLLVDSATTESAVSMTHCNPGATGKIYRLVPLQVDITQSGGIKIKYIRKKSHKRHSSKKKTSKIKSSTKRKSSKRKSIKRK
jgi:hypothetical protein